MSQINETLQRKLVKYYTEIFDPTEFLALANMTAENISTLPMRELAVLTFPYEDMPPGHLYRKLHVNTPDELGSFFANTPAYGRAWGVAKKCYFGPQYLTPFNERSNPLEMRWGGRGLLFDIDIDGSAKIREGTPCDCRGKRICPSCLDIAKEAVEFAILTLDEDFGFNKNAAEIYWSGAKGFHIHYPKLEHLYADLNEKRETEIRRMLADYIIYITEDLTPEAKREGIKKKDARPDQIMVKLRKNLGKDRPIKSELLRRRIQTIVVRNFFAKTPFNKILTLPWYVDRNHTIIDPDKLKAQLGKMKAMVLSANSADNPLYEIPTQKTGSVKSFQSKFKHRFGLDYTCTLETIMRYRYPRYDPMPTYDSRRIIKIPRTIDASTDQCYIIQRIPLKKLWDVSLSDMETLHHYVA